MSLHDSPLADAPIRKSILHMLTAAMHVPAYAKDLINRAGRAAALLLVIFKLQRNEVDGL